MEQYDDLYDEILFPMKPDERDLVYQQYSLFLDPELPVIDDGTWKDLDLDEIYTQINGTKSGVGDYCLYTMLRQPTLCKEQLQKRREVMKWAKAYPEERDGVLRALSRASKRYRSDLEQPFLPPLPLPQNRLIVYVLWLGMIASLVLMPIWIVAIFPFMLFLACSSFYYFYLHKKLEHHLDPLVYLVEQIEALHRLSKCSLDHLPEVKRQIDEMSQRLKFIRKKSALGYFEDTAGLLNAITHQESRYYERYAQFFYEQKEAVIAGLRLVGFLDACIVTTGYAGRMHANETILWSQHKTLRAKAMIHPLVEGCIANDVDLQKNQILTGSNATGKSTYLKMVALNALLAQSFGIVFAKEYEACFYRIATSMSIHDHMEKGESTFVAEGKSLKYLLDLGSDEVPALCVIDEILRGTNTLDRISASAVILHEFTKRNACCLIATHDIELTQLLHQDYDCAHFSEQMKDGLMKFDYRLHSGVTTTRNAIDLLTVFHYDPKLVQQARTALNHFERYGAWAVLDS